MEILQRRAGCDSTYQLDSRGRAKPVAALARSLSGAYNCRGLKKREVTSMRKLLAVLTVCALVWCIGASATIAGPHGCYRSQGCH
jgi:hypothetical protein